MLGVKLAARPGVPRDADLVEALFHSDFGGLVLLDSQGRVVRTNQAAQACLGARAGILLQETLPAPAAAELVLARTRDRATRLDIAVGETGAERALVLVCVPFRSGAALVRITDRTNESVLEEKLAQSQRLQEVGQLAGGIAHDFNNLLTVILGGVDELLSRPHHPDEREDLLQVRASAKRGATLVAQLLAFGQRQTLQPRVVALNDAIRGSAALLGRVLGEGIRLKLELEEPGRSVRVDPTQFDQVLVNLAVNARDAMAGQGVLTIASGHRLLLRQERIGAELAPPGRYATIEVRDTGAGIPPDILPRVMEPFFTTKRESGGTGLGLSTVHGIIRQSGGYLAIESRVGEGTCMRILLPRHEAPAPWEQAREPTDDSPGNAVRQPQTAAAVPGTSVGRVLLVEDEAPVRRLAERALKRLGYEVISAACAQDALELVDADGAPELACVVSDVVMPGMDGPALVRALRITRPHLPAVLVSGYADAPLRAQLASEHVCFLSKPFAMSDLADSVAAAVA